VTPVPFPVAQGERHLQAAAAKKARAASDSPCDAGARITEGPYSQCDRIGLGDGSSRIPQGRRCQAAAIRLRPDSRGLEQRQSCRRSPGSGMPLTHAPANRAWRALSREPGEQDREGARSGRSQAISWPYGAVRTGALSAATRPRQSASPPRPSSLPQATVR
jgi:hypothetical protein